MNDTSVQIGPTLENIYPVAISRDNHLIYGKLETHEKNNLKQT